MSRPRFCPHCQTALRLQEVDDQRILVCQNAACGFEFWPAMYPAVAVMLSNGRGEVLVTQRAREPGKGKLDWPGGFVKYGELPEAAAVREIEEELGVTITLGAFLGFGIDDYQYRGHTQLNVVAGWRAELLDTTRITPVASEIAALQWQRPQRLSPGDFAFASGRVFLQQLLGTA